MRADIHPTYSEINVTCSCGNRFTTHSTLGKDLHLDVCFKCHPFYTGKQRIVDTSGRVERFAKRYGHLKAKKAAGSDDSKAGTQD